MTKSQLIDAVCGRLNLSATDTRERIGNEIDDRYRRVTSSIGLVTARRVNVSSVTTSSDPSLTFICEKLSSVYITESGRRRVLNEWTYDQWRDANVSTQAEGEPYAYAIDEMGADSVSIVLYPTPASAITVQGDGYVNASTLGDDDAPGFPADFHDVLMHGAIADELRKMEKLGLAEDAERQYEIRLSDLRYFIAKSSYLALAQGGRSGLDRGAYRPGYAWNAFLRR